jgi:CubicO group peptidase (beta-lactamase class C family)
MKPLLISMFAATLALAAPSTQALSDAALKEKVEQRLHGDRSGACFAVAVIAEEVARALVCADPQHPRPWNADTAFEIGSVSKTMNAVLLARLVEQGKLALDDPLAQHLPKDSPVPTFDGQPIRLRHLLTHTSGLPPLPSRLKPSDPANPYAELSVSDLVASLADVELKQAPGTQWAYSNFAVMLLSHVVARAAGSDYEALMHDQLFAPLGMRSSFIARAPEQVQFAQGHLGNGLATSHWDIRGDLAGVGGVRASLSDMERYVQAHLGGAATPIADAIAATQSEVIAEPKAMAWGWMLAPLNGQRVHVHEGGTGGFSSFVAFDKARGRGVVVLADTAMTTMGGLGSLGLHLLDERVPLGKPRREVAVAKELLDAIVGEYRLPTGLKLHLRAKDGALESQADGQSAFMLGYDDAGEFFAREFDAAIRTSKRADGSHALLLLQGGGALPLTRVDAGVGVRAPAPRPSAAQLGEYAAEYAIAPNFALKVFVEGEVLKAQATGQGAFALDATAKDAFEAAAFGIEIRFKRDGSGKVSALDLHQGGRVTPAQRR